MVFRWYNFFCSLLFLSFILFDRKFLRRTKGCINPFLFNVAFGTSTVPDVREGVIRADISDGNFVKIFDVRKTVDRRVFPFFFIFNFFNKMGGGFITDTGFYPFLTTLLTDKSAQSSLPNIGRHFILPVCQLMSGFISFSQVKPKMIFCFPSPVM